jgi:toxin ParE1/3/4
MNQQVVRAPQAEADLVEIADYLARRDLTAALRFLDEAERGFASLAQMPSIGGLAETTNPRLAGLRVWPIPTFSSYLIFYRTSAETIEVVRVLHGARDLDKL